MVWSHTIKPKEVLKPLNEAEVRPSGFKGFFLFNYYYYYGKNYFK